MKEVNAKLVASGSISAVYDPEAMLPSKAIRAVADALMTGVPVKGAWISTPARPRRDRRVEVLLPTRIGSYEINFWLRAKHAARVAEIRGPSGRYYREWS